MSLPFEQIAKIAPDEKSLQAAKQSSSPRLWSELGMNGTAIWGCCQGSSPYSIAIDLADLGYRCNCPSRNRPCRHVLGLLILLSQHVEMIPTEDAPPAPVQSWLEQRKKRSQSPAATKRKATVPDEEQQRKRVAQREQKISQGLAQLDRWMSDRIRSGLAGIEGQAANLFEEQARRLVDAQAGGLANFVRHAGTIPGSSRDWPRQLLATMGIIQLIVEAYSRLDSLPEGLQSDVRQIVGWNVTQQELETRGERVEDRWIFIGQREEQDDRLRIQRNWVYGRESGRVGVILQFAPGRQPFPETFIPGTCQPATLAFYPSAVPQRAKILQSEPATLFRGDIQGAPDLDTILTEHSLKLAVQPFLMNSLYFLSDATLTRSGTHWYLRDAHGQGVISVYPEPWKLLATTAGSPATIAFEWNGTNALPVAAIQTENLIVL